MAKYSIHPFSHLGNHQFYDFELRLGRSGRTKPSQAERSRSGQVASLSLFHGPMWPALPAAGLVPARRRASGLTRALLSSCAGAPCGNTATPLRPSASAGSAKGGQQKGSCFTFYPYHLLNLKCTKPRRDAARLILPPCSRELSIRIPSSSRRVMLYLLPSSLPQPRMHQTACEGRRKGSCFTFTFPRPAHARARREPCGMLHALHI
jgi:hypothetical protein